MFVNMWTNIFNILEELISSTKLPIFLFKYDKKRMLEPINLLIIYVHTIYKKYL